MKRSPLNRSKIPLRRGGRLNKTSKRARAKIKVVREAKRELFEKNFNYCAVCGSSDTTPAHRLKQRHITNDRERRYIVPLCIVHHALFEHLGEARNFALLTFLAICLEFDRVPEVDLKTLSRGELKAFADQLIESRETRI